MESQEYIQVNGEIIPIGFCTKKELRNLFGDLSLYSLNQMIDQIEKKIGKPIGRRYNPKQICLLINTYGLAGIVYKTLFKQKTNKK